MIKTYYSLHMDFTLKKYLSFKDALNANGLYVIEEIKGSYENYGYGNPRYEYFIFDNEGMPLTKLYLNNWKIDYWSTSQSIISDDWTQDYQMFRIISPDNELIDYFTTKSKYRGIQGVSNMIQELYKVSNTIHPLDTIKELNIQMEQLKEENNILRNYISSVLKRELDD